jgi:hydroxypyruvate isomerase
MQLSGCVEMLFKPETDDFPARIRACRAAGLDGVEFWGWRTKDLDAIEAALRETGLTLTGLCVDPPGSIVDPATHADFLRAVRESIPVAQRLGAPCLIVVTGDARPGIPFADQRQAIVDALREAAPIAEAGGTTLVLEPLNTAHDHVGYFLDSTAVGLDIVAEVASPAVRLLYDIYHSAMMNEDPAIVLAGKGALLGHVHAADTHGRHEPGSGTIDWSHALSTLRAVGYSGAVGLEFRPRSGTSPALERGLAVLREAGS